MWFRSLDVALAQGETLPAVNATLQASTANVLADPFNFKATGFGPDLDASFSPAAFIHFLQSAFPYYKTVHAAYHHPVDCDNNSKPSKAHMQGYYSQVHA